MADRQSLIGRLRGLVLVLSALLAGCASPPTPPLAAAPSSAAPSRTLVMVVNVEVNNLAGKSLGPPNPYRITRMFNADLVQLDPQKSPIPYLAQSLPELNTDSWQVFPGGRMETTWKLRPGLTWHDGRPLTAEDVVFASRLYKMPELAAMFDPKPQDLVEEVSLVDPLTIRVGWRSPFLHLGDGLNPLPRALLSEAFGAFVRDPPGQREAFTSMRFWTTGMSARARIA